MAFAVRAVSPGRGPNPALLAEAGAPSPPGAVLAGERLLPVVPALEDLFPGGGVRRGSTVAVSGSTSLALAVLAGPSAAGSWCAAVGLPALGLMAAAEMGVALERLALVPWPGAEWAAVVAALLDALDVVVVGAGTGAGAGWRVRPGDARRLVARARERGSVLLVVGAWEGADVRLSVGGLSQDQVQGRSQWHGLGTGHGHLRSRMVEVRAEGRGAASRSRGRWLWLPSEGGGVALA